jgi:hypothetical protein
MRAGRLAAVSAAAVVLALTGCTPPESALAGAEHGLVAAVVDGDTIKVETATGTVRVRIIGINTPEIGRDGKPSECYAEQARDYLDQLAYGRTVVAWGHGYDPHGLAQRRHILPRARVRHLQAAGPDGVAAIEAAIGAGYRLLDSAVNYENEAEVGEAVRRSGIRDELIVTTKVPGRDHGHDETIRSAHASLERLGLERIDLYLIHWPNPSVNRYVETFRAMIDLQNDGKVGSVGVSNFTEEMLSR